MGLLTLGFIDILSRDIAEHQAFYDKNPVITIGETTMIRLMADMQFYKCTNGGQKQTILGCEYKIGDFEFGYMIK
jgi:hypothetical protein